MACGPWLVATAFSFAAMVERASSQETGSKRPSPLGPTRLSGRVNRSA